MNLLSDRGRRPYLLPNGWFRIWSYSMLDEACSSNSVSSIFADVRTALTAALILAALRYWVFCLRALVDVGWICWEFAASVWPRAGCCNHRMAALLAKSGPDLKTKVNIAQQGSIVNGIFAFRSGRYGRGSIRGEGLGSPHSPGRGSMPSFSPTLRRQIPREA